MSLLNEKTFENEIVLDMHNLMNGWINQMIRSGNISFSNMIEYDSFRELMKEYIKSVMECYLKDTIYKDDICEVKIGKISGGALGFFYGKDKGKNLVVIDELIVENIYYGFVEKFVHIFHELNHFKIKYDILLGVINEDMARILKEILIRDTCYDMNKFTSNKDKYYYDNYLLNSEEIFANMEAKRNYIYMISRLTVEPSLEKVLSIEDVIRNIQLYFKNEILDEGKRYNNSIRDFSSVLFVNSNYLSLNDAFDLFIKNHTEWVKYPLIGLEYYVRDNEVIKRSVSELKELYNNCNDMDSKEYILSLIDGYDKVKKDKCRSKIMDK